MKQLIPLLALIGTVFTPPAFAASKIRVVATIPELVDIAQRIGGALVEVQGLAHGTEDIHQVTMRPSYVTRLNRADAVVMLGLTIEHAFLPGLLEVADNPNIKSDPRGCSGPGCIDCSEGILILGRPATLSRTEGEQHPQGNPHYNLSPDNGSLIAGNIARGLTRLYPNGKATFEKNLADYLSELDAKVQLWRTQVTPLAGVKAVSFHDDVVYLGRFTGINFVGTVEVKPGIAPTPSHLAQLVSLMKEQNVKLIVREQQYEPKTAEWLAAQTGAKIAVIGAMANALPATDTFEKMSEHNLRALLEAAQ